MGNSQNAFMKRQRELQSSQRRKEKAARKAERAAQKTDHVESDVDPDIAHIVPGPQPLPWDDEEEVEDGEAEN